MEQVRMVEIDHYISLNSPISDSNWLSYHKIKVVTFMFFFL